MTDYSEHGAVPVEDAAVDDPPTMTAAGTDEVSATEQAGGEVVDRQPDGIRDRRPQLGLTVTGDRAEAGERHFMDIPSSGRITVELIGDPGVRPDVSPAADPAIASPSLRREEDDHEGGDAEGGEAVEVDDGLRQLVLDLGAPSSCEVAARFAAARRTPLLNMSSPVSP